MDGVVQPLRVAAVDDQVALGEDAGELGDHVVGDLAVRDHDPHELLALGERCREVGEAGHIGDGGVRVVPGDLDACVAETGTHVVAHATEADKTDVHDFLFCSSSR
ncbi:Uncharacterised protein [Mycobacteroides abscessus subsp. abscessus]|nr:Uncharacterised protein [Mycobacteroides abscessus subsp. abscessus]